MTVTYNDMAIYLSLQSDGHFWKSDRHFFKVTSRWPKPLFEIQKEMLFELIFVAVITQPLAWKMFMVVSVWKMRLKYRLLWCSPTLFILHKIQLCMVQWKWVIMSNGICYKRMADITCHHMIIALNYYFSVIIE